MKKISTIILLTTFFSTTVFGQTVIEQKTAINETGTPAANSAMLDVNATDKGILIPRINIENLSNAAPVISPDTSLLVYNNNTATKEGFYYWNGSKWVALTLEEMPQELERMGDTIAISDGNEVSIIASQIEHEDEDTRLRAGADFIEAKIGGNKKLMFKDSTFLLLGENGKTSIELASIAANGTGSFKLLKNEKTAAELLVNDGGAGRLTLYDSLGVENARLSSFSGHSGGLALSDTLGDVKLFGAAANSQGVLLLKGKSGADIVSLNSTDTEDGDKGEITIYKDGQPTGQLLVNDGGAGRLSLYDSLGLENVRLTSIDGHSGGLALFDTFGIVKVYAAAYNEQGFLEVKGKFGFSLVTIGSTDPDDPGSGATGRIAAFDSANRAGAYLQTDSLYGYGELYLGFDIEEDYLNESSVSLYVDADKAGYLSLDWPGGDEPFVELFKDMDDVGTAVFNGPNSLNIKLGAVSALGDPGSNDLGKITLFNENDKATVDIKSFDEYGEINFLDTFGVVGASLGNLSDPSTGHGSGFLRLKSNDGSNSIYARGADGNGIISIYSDTTSSPDNIAIDLYAQSGNGNGAIELFEKGDASNAKAIIEVNPTNGHGGAFFIGSNESTNIFITGIDSGTTGYISTNDENGNQQARMYAPVFYGGAGVFQTFGPNGSFNSHLGAVIGSNNHGALALFDASNNVKVEMLVTGGGDGIAQAEILRTIDQKASMFTDGSGDGVVMADVKNFSMPHPFLEDKRIVYACIEGPEAAAYARGTAQLQNGKATIELPEHFRLVAAEEGMTVILTPLSAQSKGLAVTRKSLEGIEVQEMFAGQGHYEFDWEVKSIRKGYENYEVIRDNDKPHLKKYTHEYRSEEGAKEQE